VADDPNADIVLLPMPLDYGEHTTLVARAIADVQKQVKTPLLPVWMSDSRGSGFQILADAGLCSPHSLSKAIMAVSRWADYGNWSASARRDVPPLTQATQRPPSSPLPALNTEPEAKRWLAKAGIAVPDGLVVTDEASARQAAHVLGERLVVKVVAPGIAHKSDVGGVRLDLRGADSVAEAFTAIVNDVKHHAPQVQIDGVLIERMAPAGLEIIVGVHRDPTFGHLLTVGVGGVLVETLDDVARALLPINLARARQLIDSLRSREILNGARGGPVYDAEALVALLVGVSDIVGEYSDQIDEIELNPVLLTPIESPDPPALVLDALVVLSGSGAPVGA
jgi:acetate---CoA ligase (ADP-forming)